MVKINKIEEIDHEKLNTLFRSRGRKITIPLFTKTVLDVLETDNKKFEVHQCGCGEVARLRTDYADYLRERLNSENIPCNSCLGMGDSAVLGRIFTNLFNILHILEKRKIDKIQNRVYFADDDFEQLKNETKGLFATQSVDEFYFGFYSFINAFFDEIQRKESHEHYPVVSEIIDTALIINPEIHKEFGADVNAAIEFDAASLNIYLSEKLRIDLLSKISDEKFLMSEISELPLHESSSSYSKSDIKLMMIEYKDLVEVKNYLDLLLNLINIIEGRKFIPNPFDKLKLPPMESKGNERKIRGLHDKIELFKYHSFGDKLYPLLLDIFDTKLRNDEAHNTYEIDIERKIIKSTRYNKETTFDELSAKVSKLSSFHFFLSDEWIKKYRNLIKPFMKDLGIEEVVLGYEDPILIGDKLFPNNMCLSELGIYQYWDFAYYENEKRWIPTPNLSINNKELIFSFENGGIFSYKLDSDVELWLDQLILHGAYNLCLYTIAPLLPSFNTKSIIQIPVGTTPKINILEVTNTIIELPIKLIKEIDEKK